jgi:hypothetical protein
MPPQYASGPVAHLVSLTLPTLIEAGTVALALAGSLLAVPAAVAAGASPSTISELIASTAAPCLVTPCRIAPRLAAPCLAAPPARCNVLICT